MQAPQSHGRLRAILPATALFLAGSSIGIFLKFNQDRNSFERKNHSELKSQMDILQENLWLEIEDLKTTALRIKSQRDQVSLEAGESLQKVQPFPSEHVIHWAEIAIQNQEIHSVIQTSQNPAFTSESGFERMYLDQILKKIDIAAIRTEGMGFYLYESESNARQPWVALAFIPNGQKHSRQSMLLTLINPNESFGIFKRLSPSFEEAKRRAYLIVKDGTVLAHSQVSYLGSQFKGSEIFDKGVSSLFRGPLTKGVATQVIEGSGSFTNIDDIPVHAVFIRPRGLPMAIVLEQLRPQVLQTGGSRESFFITFVSIALMLGGAILVFALWIRNVRAGRRSKPNPKELEPLNLPAQTPQTVTQAPAPKTTSPLAPKPIVRPYTGPSHQQVIQLVSQFEVNAKQIRDARLVASMLTQAASRICQSPVLFFRFDPAHSIAVLETDWGFDKGQEPVSMAFSIPKGAVSKILQVSSEQKLASLSNFEPLSQLIMGRMNVAVYEAWAVTTSTGPVASRLVGVLVILKSGVQSTLNRDSLVQMMRTTGRLYEPTASRPTPPNHNV